VARASRKHPILLVMLADGRLHLTAIVRLAPHLTRENMDGVLERATHRSKRQILELVAEIAPRPDVPVTVRKLPERKARPSTHLVVPTPSGSPILELGLDRVAAPEPRARPNEVAVSAPAVQTGAPTVGHDPSAVPAWLSTPASPVPPVAASPVCSAVVEPLSPGRYKVQFTASAQFHQKLERLRALMGSRGPDADLAAVLEQAVTEKLERLEARRFARTSAPRKRHAPAETVQTETVETETRETKTGAKPDSSPSSRYIPAAVRRAVHERDGDRCCYIDKQGRRCPEQNRLEFHHRHPFGLGGDHSVANVGLLCRPHNIFLAECDYGRNAMVSHRRPEPGSSPR
jgi:5-methylcytosine-specific restriction endonuclease McrA